MRRCSILLVVGVILIGIASPCAAVTGHNLHWGFEVGDRVHYKASGPDYEIFSNFYVEIEFVPTLPEDITEYHQILSNQLYYSMYFENGTPSSMYEGIWTALPIGNWPFIQQLLNYTSLYYDEFNWINTATEWGIRYSEDFSSATRISTVKFSKSDGGLTLFQVVTDPVEGQTVTNRIERVGLLSTPMVLVAIGAAIIIVVVIGLVLFKSRR